MTQDNRWPATPGIKDAVRRVIQGAGIVTEQSHPTVEAPKPVLAVLASLATAADEMIAAYGGDIPDWLDDEVASLNQAIADAQQALAILPKIAKLEDAIRVSRAKFAEYAAYQRAKRTDEADARASENEKMVALCDDMLFDANHISLPDDERLAALKNHVVACRERFQLYAVSHQQRGGAEHEAKAKVNLELAALLTRALT